MKMDALLRHYQQLEEQYLINARQEAIWKLEMHDLTFDLPYPQIQKLVVSLQHIV